MEPFITSSLSVSQKIPTKEISGLTTGLVINSKVGPIEATKVTSPKQFLDLYTVTGGISKGDHASMHNAFFLSRFTDLVIIRATNTNIIPLTGLQSTIDSVLLGSGKYSDSVDTIAPTLPNNHGDVKSLWLQVGKVLFYGSDGVDPFTDGTGIANGTATRRVKGTELDQLENEGLGVPTDWTTVQLSQPLAEVDSNNASAVIFNTDAYLEIAEHFKRGGDAERGNLYVKVTSNKLKVYYNSEFPVISNSFMPLDRDGIDVNDPNDNPVHNISKSDGITQLSTTTEPFLIGSTNVGSANTVTAWVSDYELKSDGFQYWNLNIEDKVRGINTYKASDNPDAIDAQGNPIYYTVINETRPDIIYVKNERSTKKVIDTARPGQPNIGRSQDFIDSQSTSGKLLSSAIYAASKFEDYTDSRIQLYTDAGWYNKAIAKAFEAISASTKSLTCVGIDPTVTDENVAITYAAGFNSYYSIVHFNGGKDTSVVGFQLPISPSCYYIETVARNSTRNNSYAPVFSKVNGPISEANLYKSHSKSVRNKLNNSRVNVLMYDDTDGVSYINNNLLTDSSGSLIDEDQSIRIVNDIQFDIDKMMEKFYSRFNIDTTRAIVESSIKNYFETVILSQNYTIGGYRVECSEVNNSEANIQNNELKVSVYIKLNHSIKYITVSTNVVPTV